jgi:hypothetical protein
VATLFGARPVVARYKSVVTWYSAMSMIHWVSSLQCGVIDRFITQRVSSVELLDLKSSRLY